MPSWKDMKRFCENSSWECINQQAITFLYSGKGGIRRMRPFARMLVTSPTVASAPVPGSYNLLKMLAQEHFLNANCPHGFEFLPNFFIKEK